VIWDLWPIEERDHDTPPLQGKEWRNDRWQRGCERFVVQKSAELLGNNAVSEVHVS
jgi:hypothetical protein